MTVKPGTEKPWTVTAMKTLEGFVFHHEADDVLHALCSDFETGKLTEAQVREALIPYAEFVDLGDFDDMSDVGSGFGFPFACDDVYYMPATEDFEAWAAGLGIPGVHWKLPNGTDSSVMTGDGYVVADNEEALQQLRQRAEGRYDIVNGIW
jgi:hypothetical protein